MSRLGIVCLCAAVIATGAAARAQQRAPVSPAGALPAPPPAQPRPAPPRAAPLPILPLTQLDDRVLAADLDNTLVSITFAQPVPIRDVLLLLARDTNLSVLPDPSLTATFVGDLKNVTVRQALALMLPPLGLDYRVDGSAIHVFARQPETRMFDINYVATVRSGSSTIGSAEVRVASATNGDLFGDLAKGVQALLSDQGAFNLDRKAGLLQVTDLPDRLDRVAVYLDAVQDRAVRQVQIDVQVLELELKDEKAQSLDWDALARAMTGAPAGGTERRPPSATLRITDVPKFLAALAEQGKVAQLASPRLITLNNEPALVRGDDETLELAVSVTPQIAGDGTVMLSLSPVLALPERESEKEKRPRALREADTLARVADGETIVVAGFWRDREVRERKSVGVTGGWFGRGTVVTKKRTELLLLLTPRVRLS